VQSVLKHYLAFSSGLAESMGIQDNPQLAVLLLYVSTDAVVKEILGLVALTFSGRSAPFGTVMSMFVVAKVHQFVQSGI
jgi:hypothetical protein